MSKRLGVMAAAVLAVGLGASQANAGLVINLQYDDGTTTKVAAPGTYTVKIYADITGGDATTDSLTSAYVSMWSSQTAGGAATGTGDGFTSGGVNTTQFTSAAQNGTLLDYNADGVIDVGNGSTTTTNTTLIKAAQSATSPVVGNHLLLGTYTFTVTQVGAGTTTIGAIVPIGTSTLPGAIWKEAGTSTKSTLSSYTAGQTVSLTSGAPVPEPASLGLLAMGALGLIARRRK